ncbi:MAG: hypothetical protein PVF05_08790 [Gemmatimonadales bacterium]
MRRILLLVGALASFAGAAPPTSARTTDDPDREEECRNYCGEKAAQRCDDVSSTWCNVYIVGCLAGCGVTNC